MAAGERVSGLLTLAMPGTVAALSWAQSSTTALRGTILDPNGALVPGGGSSSRPLGFLFGMAMTHGCTAKGKEGAPVQLPVAEVRQIVESLWGEPGKSSVSHS
jgi:hypothetical protein